MDARVRRYAVPVATVNVFNTIVVITLIPIFDRWIYPFVDYIA